MSITLTEIAQQPDACDRTLRSEAKRMIRVARAIRKRDVPLIVLAARGTSDNAALFARYLLEIRTGIPVSLSAPSVHTIYRSRLNLSNTLVVGISQSGEGMDINVVLERCKKSGARVFAITNSRHSNM